MARGELPRVCPRWEPRHEKSSRAAFVTSGPNSLTSAGNCRAAPGSGRIRRSLWRSGPVMRGGWRRVGPRWEARREKSSHAAPAMWGPSSLTSAGTRRASLDSGCVWCAGWIVEGALAVGSRPREEFSGCVRDLKPSSPTGSGNRRASPGSGRLRCLAWRGGLVARSRPSRVGPRWEARCDKRSHAAVPTSCTARTFGRGVRAAWV